MVIRVVIHRIAADTAASGLAGILCIQPIQHSQRLAHIARGCQL
jgi:hypothetical protein